MEEKDRERCFLVCLVWFGLWENCSLILLALSVASKGYLWQKCQWRLSDEMVFDLEAQHRGRSQPNKYVRGDMATSPGARARQG